jgi:formamidopyrimidine-DNA glycosylase
MADWLARYTGWTLVGIDWYVPAPITPLLLPDVLHVVECYGKKIVLQLSQQALIIGLGMTGRIATVPSPHSRVAWHVVPQISPATSSLTPLVRVTWYLEDSRKFGKVTAVPGNGYYHLQQRYGPDPLRTPLRLEQWSRILDKYPRRSLATLLMKGDSLYGVGNYLKAEILYAARLAPMRLVSSLSYDERQALMLAINFYIDLAYRQGGLTIRDFWTPEGRPGEFVAVVYGRDRDPLGYEVVKQQTADGRITHWVPGVQR